MLTLSRLFQPVCLFPSWVIRYCCFLWLLAWSSTCEIPTNLPHYSG